MRPRHAHSNRAISCVYPAREISSRAVDFAAVQTSYERERAAEPAADSIAYMNVSHEKKPGGEITMRKALAIDHVTHDGVIQSPGAFQ
jgi:hypothetical protein